MKIARSSATRQYEHIGNIRHGVQTGPWRVEFDAPVAVDETNHTEKLIYQGSVISLNANGEYVAGCGAGTGANRPVPFISMKNIMDPDVTTGITGKNKTVSTISAVGDIITAIPCTSGYEIETTEFVPGEYAVNDALTAASGDDLGKVKAATTAWANTEPVLGFVSLAPGMDRSYNPAQSVDYLGNARLAFFTCFIPAGVRS